MGQLEGHNLVLTDPRDDARNHLNRAVFLSYLQYVGIAKAARKSGIYRKAAMNIKN